MPRAVGPDDNRRMRAKLSRAVAALALLAAGLAVAPAAAGPEQDKAEARQLGIEGVKAYDAGDWQGAIKSFEQAERLFHAPTHLLYIARAQVKLGQLLAARETYTRLEKEALPPGASPAFKKAQVDAGDERRQLEGKIPTLVVRVQPPDLQGVEVLLDGKAVEGSSLGGALVDPGRHRVEARAGDRAAAPIDIEVVVGEKREIVLDFSAPTEAKPPPPPTTTPPEDEGGGVAASTVLGISALGLGVAGVGVGAVFGIMSLGKTSDADALYEQCGGDGGCDQSSSLGEEVQAIDDDAATFGTISVIALGAGAAFAATGVVILVVGGGDDAPSDARVHVMPTAGGAMVRGSF